DDLHPFRTIDPFQTALEGNRCPSQSGNQSMTFTCWDAKIPSGRCPKDNRKHCCTKGYNRFLNITAQINHIVNGLRNGGINHCHYYNSKEVHHRSKDNRGTYTNTSCRYRRCNCIWGIRPTVYQNDAKGKENGNEHNWI